MAGTYNLNIGNGYADDGMPMYLHNTYATSAQPNDYASSVFFGQAATFELSGNSEGHYTGIVGFRAEDVQFAYHNDAAGIPTLAGFNLEGKQGPFRSTDSEWTGGGVLSIRIDGGLVEVGHEAFTGAGKGRERGAAETHTVDGKRYYDQVEGNSMNTAETYLRVINDNGFGVKLGINGRS